MSIHVFLENSPWLFESCHVHVKYRSKLVQVDRKWCGIKIAVRVLLLYDSRSTIQGTRGGDSTIISLLLQYCRSSCWYVRRKHLELSVASNV